MTLNWNPRFRSLRSIWDVMLSKPTWLSGSMVAAGMAAISAVMDKLMRTLLYSKRNWRVSQGKMDDETVDDDESSSKAKKNVNWGPVAFFFPGGISSPVSCPLVPNNNFLARVGTA
jgi:hypothetical protein